MTNSATPSKKTQTLWVACYDAGAANVLKKITLYDVDEQDKLNKHHKSVENILLRAKHHKSAESILLKAGYLGPFVFFEGDGTAALVAAGREISQVKPVVVAIYKDQNPELIDNHNATPISIMDYDAAYSYDSATNLMTDYGDSARRDNGGEWYVERGNVPAQSWQGKVHPQNARQFWVSSIKHDGLAVSVTVDDEPTGSLTVATYGEDFETGDLTPVGGELKLSLAEHGIDPVKDPVSFEFEPNAPELDHYAFIGALKFTIVVKQDDEGLVIDVFDKNDNAYADSLASTYVFYDELHQRPDADGVQLMA